MLEMAGKDSGQLDDRGTSRVQWIVHGLAVLFTAAFLSLLGCSGCCGLVSPVETTKTSVSPDEEQPKETPVAETASSAGSAGQTDGAGIGAAARADRPGNTGGQAGASTPGQALNEARHLQQLAQSAQAAGDFSKAFLHTRDAWQAVKTFPDEVECRKLSQQLFNEVEELGQKANAKYSGEAQDPDKPLLAK